MCASAIFTPEVHEAIKTVPGVFRFKWYRHEVPLLADLLATDRCCITFRVSCSELAGIATGISRIYQELKAKVLGMPKQELQRVIPLFWSMNSSIVPEFFKYSSIAFLDVRSCTKLDKCKIQAILIAMEMPYYFQTRSILAVYAAGVTLENFRQPVFQEHIILRFGKEEGCFQCVFYPSNLKDAWQVDISQLEAPCVKLTK